MSLHKAKPTSAGRRFVVSVKTPGLHKGKPYEALIEKKMSKGGRNNNGRITVRHKGGGHKQRYRIVDFKRDKDGIPGVVERLEYDPNRSAHLALIKYADGERRYILAPKGVAAGTPIISGEEAPIKPGNSLPLRVIPVGTVIHNIEMKPGKGGQMVRSAGGYAQLAAREGAYATHAHCAPAETRKVHVDCRATIGEVGNNEHNLRKLGKAGAKQVAWRAPDCTRCRDESRSITRMAAAKAAPRVAAIRYRPWGVRQPRVRRPARNKRTENMIVRRRKRK